ncbi:hypothetical protein DPMN_017462 [Dreissena polymorpha]|uniref:Uncharacterized protein n=1 Tax=Dreissena polymorpha TaxID=45954 RepID=A0A9D4ND90_DREPO|nr:hypothetical protein DPMN_017462 [Dreissena polymorpha]
MDLDQHGPTIVKMQCLDEVKKICRKTKSMSMWNKNPIFRMTPKFKSGEKDCRECKKKTKLRTLFEKGPCGDGISAHSHFTAAAQRNGASNVKVSCLHGKVNRDPKNGTKKKICKREPKSLHSRMTLRGNGKVSASASNVRRLRQSKMEEFCNGNLTRQNKKCFEMFIKGDNNVEVENIENEHTSVRENAEAQVFVVFDDMKDMEEELYDKLFGMKQESVGLVGWEGFADSVTVDNIDSEEDGKVFLVRKSGKKGKHGRYLPLEFPSNASKEKGDNKFATAECGTVYSLKQVEHMEEDDDADLVCSISVENERCSRTIKQTSDVLDVVNKTVKSGTNVKIDGYYRSLKHLKSKSTSLEVSKIMPDKQMVTSECTGDYVYKAGKKVFAEKDVKSSKVMEHKELSKLHDYWNLGPNFHGSHLKGALFDACNKFFKGTSCS